LGFKHPTPDDFFRTMENVAGEDLSWFWRGWFEYNGVLIKESILLNMLK
jgi:aminopeptidase N